MKIANIIAYVLVILGAVNWGLYGIFNFNLVSMIFGGARAVGSIVVYSIITLAAVWLIFRLVSRTASLLLRTAKRIKFQVFNTEEILYFQFLKLQNVLKSAEQRQKRKSTKHLSASFLFCGRFSAV